MRKKPYMGSELFNEICKRITLPESILDYYRGEFLDDEEINSYEWDFGNHLEYGGNEGIYLTMYAESYKAGEPCKTIALGTFKTLLETPEAMHTMANLLADFIIAGKKFVNDNLDDFTWDGFNVKATDSCISFDCLKFDRAMEKYYELKQKHDEVIIFDYAARKEIKI